VGISYPIQAYNRKPIYRAQIDTTARDLRVSFCVYSWKESSNRLKNGESSSLFPQAAKFWFVLSSLYTSLQTSLTVSPPLSPSLYLASSNHNFAPNYVFFSPNFLSPWCVCVCVCVCDAVTDSVPLPTKAKQEIIKKSTRPSNELDSLYWGNFLITTL
jgi:hypothetical protein